jgi:outer membrane protein OmpA-like peptidoglycan-associated protein
VIDTERSKLISRVKGNDYLTLPDPRSKSGKLTLISSAFGYRRLQLEINYKSTEQDTLQPYVALMGNYYMIKFDMVRLHRGDISTLYNVYFYNDAAVMLPESKYELNTLLQMMKDNPRYRIRLHGHTNGSRHGKVITMGESKSFFTLTADVKNGIGSARDLSRERAKVIRDWLVANDISAARMEIKAWGGSRMIHDKNSVQARKNVRVEVEVLED